jgi:hypothetical protein
VLPLHHEAKEGKFEYHIVPKSQMTMTEHMLRHDPAAAGTNTNWTWVAKQSWLPIPTILGMDAATAGTIGAAVGFIANSLITWITDILKGSSFENA